MIEVPEPEVVAAGLQFPEGPVALGDGSVLVVEIRRGTLSRVTPDGAVEVVATLPDTGWGGPNGAAIGPDGAVYVCHNGGFPWTDRNGMHLPIDLETGSMFPPDYDGGSIRRVDLDTGDSEVVLTHCGDHRLVGPNDLVFDRDGGMWFTDMGKSDRRIEHRGGVFHAAADGSRITEVVVPLHGPNGIGLSPDGATLYVAETHTGRLWAWDIAGPGQVDPFSKRCLANTLGSFDSLAVDAAGRICVAAINDGVCVVEPDGSGHEFVPMPGPFCTNICFGGPDLRTAYLTLSGTGQLVATTWPGPGLELAYTR